MPKGNRPNRVIVDSAEKQAEGRITLEDNRPPASWVGSSFRFDSHLDWGDFEITGVDTETKTIRHKPPMPVGVPQNRSEPITITIER